MPPLVSSFVSPTPLCTSKYTFTTNINACKPYCGNRVHSVQPAKSRHTTLGSATVPVPTTAEANADLTIKSNNDSDVTNTSGTRFGFASLLGPSNSGKSTLLNQLVGSKVAIVTPKEQTTRCRISGIAIFGSTQVAFLDTPGIFDAHARFDRAMVKSAWTSGKSADATAVVMDAAEMYHVARKRGKYVPHVSQGLELVVDGLVRRAERIREQSTISDDYNKEEQPICFVSNKMDKIPSGVQDEFLIQVKELLIERGVYEPLILPCSAIEGNGIESLIIWVVAKMPKGQWMYPEDYMTDMSSRLIASEITREKLMLSLRDEIPYEIAVETVSWKILKDGSIRIQQEILVRRESQIRIVTGKGGIMVKNIGIQSRHEIAQILGTNIHLIIRVKVRKWKDEANSYSQWGLDYKA